MNTSTGQWAESNRIAIVVDNEANGDRLAEWLSPTYDVVRPNPQQIDEVLFDLCILDKSILEAHSTALQRRKERADPEFLPYLLVSTTQSRRPSGSRVLNFVDEVVSVPTEKAVLKRRLTNLLERRELSTHLSIELDQQRELFRNIFESSNDAILIIDPEDVVIRECNPQASELLGYTRKELRSLSVEEIHPGQLSVCFELLDTVIEDGQGQTEELRCRTKNGEALNAEISASSIEIDGRPHMLASIRDVTTRNEQRRVLESLHEISAELMQAPSKVDIADVAVEAAQEVFEFESASVHLVADTDPATLELVAASSDVYSRLDADESVCEVDEGVVGQAFEQQDSIVVDSTDSEGMALSEGPIQSVMCVPLGSHGVLSLGTTETAVFDEMQFELTAVLATNTTAALTRAQREQALNERTEYLSALYENTTDCIVEVEFEDATPSIRDTNPAFEQVFGYDTEDIRGESLTELVVPPDKKADSESLTHHALAGDSVELKTRRDTATGRRDFLLRVVPIQQDGETIGAYIVYTDITERKHREQQLQVLNRVFRHNIRNKLNVVQAALEQTSGSEATPSRPVKRKGLDAIEELLSLSETAYELPKVTAPQNTPESISVDRIIERAVRSVREEHSETTISTNITTDRWVPGRTQLDRALRELIENAIEHTDQSEPAVEITVEQNDERDDWVTITIEDNGPGIPDDQLAVFEKGEETQLEHGNGLGLWVVQWIIRTAGGELRLAEADPRGAVVTMQVPTVEARDQPTRTSEGPNR